MSKFARAKSDAREALVSLPTKAREHIPGYLKAIHTPRFLEKPVDGATRAGQIISLLFLGPVIVVSLALIVVLNSILSDIFGTSDYGETQGGIIGWLITAITGGALLMAAWSWFQFVRTAGFGWFSFD